MFSKFIRVYEGRRCIERFANRSFGKKVAKDYFLILKLKSRELAIKRIEKEKKEDIIANTYLNQKYLPKKFIRLWKSVIILIKEERWRESRRNVLREKISEILLENKLEESFSRTSIFD
jgi:hypothetical protein